MMQLALASSSRYRRELLTRFRVPFTWQSPHIDEEPRPAETATDTALRLAEAKAQALRETFTDHLIIGSDQVAWFAGHQVSKPGNHRNAVSQLQQFSGQTVQFFTAVCVYNSRSKTSQTALALTTVRFRQLPDNEIERYLRIEQPYHCTGSFMAEGLGITLFDQISSDDPTAIIGLPLIKLRQLLAEQGYDILNNIH